MHVSFRAHQTAGLGSSLGEGFSLDSMPSMRKHTKRLKAQERFMKTMEEDGAKGEKVKTQKFVPSTGH